MRPSNDSLRPVPRPLEGGPGLDVDFPGLRIGAAEYDEGPTGCTVFHFPERATVSIDVRGGAPGWCGGDGLIDAICLAGGSAYGLEAISGVRAELLAGRGYSTSWLDIALVGGAIIYDFGPRDSAVYPDVALGRAALRAARPGWFPLGPRGAGRSATVGKQLRGPDGREAAGQGGAFRQVGANRVAVFTVVNAVGAIVDRRGRVVRGNRDPATGARGDLAGDLERALAEAAAPPPGNTTLTVVVTNRRLGSHELRQLGRQVHASMARAIQPFHALTDGDVLFAVATGALDDDRLPAALLATLASELAWDAVLASPGA
ncbi:MAG TPA: P1 family peptidase [Chloroflexota bacterium]